MPVPAVVQTRVVLGYEVPAHHQGGACQQAGRQRVRRAKLTNPDHRSHVSQVQKALRAVGRRLKVEVAVA